VQSDARSITAGDWKQISDIVVHDVQQIA